MSYCKNANSFAFIDFVYLIKSTTATDQRTISYT